MTTCALRGFVFAELSRNQTGHCQGKKVSLYSCLDVRIISTTIEVKKLEKRQILQSEKGGVRSGWKLKKREK